MLTQRTQSSSGSVSSCLDTEKGDNEVWKVRVQFFLGAGKAFLENESMELEEENPLP